MSGSAREQEPTAERPLMRNGPSCFDQCALSRARHRHLCFSLDVDLHRRGQFGMYGPPSFCKRKMKMTELVCANVFGLCRSSDLLAWMECAALLSYLVTQAFKPIPNYRFQECRVRPLCHRHGSPANLAGKSNMSYQPPLVCNCGNRVSDFQAWCLFQASIADQLFQSAEVSIKSRGR
jgi:hypothetical protein